MATLMAILLIFVPVSSFCADNPPVAVELDRNLNHENIIRSKTPQAITALNLKQSIRVSAHLDSDTGAHVSHPASQANFLSRCPLRLIDATAMHKACLCCAPGFAVHRSCKVLRMSLVEVPGVTWALESLALATRYHKRAGRLGLHGTDSAVVSNWWILCSYGTQTQCSGGLRLEAPPTLLPPTREEAAVAMVEEAS